MGRARLTRIDAVEEISAAVDAFRNEASAALEGLAMEIQRAQDWIHTDRHEHWNHEVRRGWERITAARVELQQAMTSRRIGNHDPACIDEKKALALAKRRLEIAQEKVEAVRHSARAIDRGVDEYRGARTPLAGWLESELPKALAALRRMMDNLEAYLALNASGGSAGAISAAGRAEEAPATSGDSVGPTSPSGQIKGDEGVPAADAAGGAALIPGSGSPASPEGGVE